MAELYLPEFPEELRRALSERAGRTGRSIPSEVIRLLETALESEAVDRAELVERIRSAGIRVKPGAPSAAELIREDRER